MSSANKWQFYLFLSNLDALTMKKSCHCSVTQSYPTLQPHGLQHSRPLCPLPFPKVCPSSCPLYQWCHSAISSSDALFSFCLQSFLASGTFPMSQLFALDDQNTGVSASASVLLMSIQVDFPYNWLVWSPCCPTDSQESTSAPQLEGINSLVFCLLYSPALTTVCDHWEGHSLDYRDLCQQSDVSAFQHTLSRFVITFLPRSNHLLILWLQSQSTVILKPKKRKSVTASTFPPSICHAVMGPNVMILVFFNI